MTQKILLIIVAVILFIILAAGIILLFRPESFNLTSLRLPPSLVDSPQQSSSGTVPTSENTPIPLKDLPKSTDLAGTPAIDKKDLTSLSGKLILLDPCVANLICFEVS